MTLHFFSKPEGRNGTLMGHAPAGLLMMGIASFLMFQMFLRVRRIQHFLKTNLNHKKKNESSRSIGAIYAQAHFPEKDMMMYRTIGTIVVVGTGIMMVAEQMAKMFDPTYKGSFQHQILYFNFMMIGLSQILESYGRLPPESARIVFGVTMMVEYIMLYPHAKMKEGAVDQSLHVYQSYFGFVNSLAMFYSVANPKSVVAYIFAMAIFFLQGCWWITIGFYMGGIDYAPHMIPTILASEILLLTLVIMILCASFLPPTPPSSSNDNTQKNNNKNINSYNNWHNDTDLEDTSEQLFEPLSLAME